MTALDLGPDFAIDANLATRRAILLGQPDVGKTNGLTVIAEGLLTLGVPVAILDWKGDLWGLRSSRSGEEPGFPVVIFGGDHADVDVTEGDGREIGTVVATERIPAIIDLSAFESNAARRRFATAFLRAFLQAKAPEAYRTPHPVLIDEFQEFAPERPYGEQVALLGAVQSVFSLGRKRGIGVLGTSLRAAQLAKSALELSDAYLFMQTAGRNDLKAIDETLRRYATAEELESIRKAIPRLGKGEVLVYSPAWLRILETHRFRLRSTFDSSRTPEVGAAPVEGPRAFAVIDVPAIAERIAATREEREAEDPVALRAQIQDLQRRLAAQTPVEINIPVPVVSTELVDEIVRMRARAQETAKEVEGVLAGAKYALASLEDLLKLAQAIPRAVEVQTTADAARKAPAKVAERPHLRAHGIDVVIASDHDTLSRGAKGLLDTLASRYPMKMTRAQLATLSGRSIRSSSFSAHIAELVNQGIAQKQGDLLSLAGQPAHTTRATTPDELLDLWTAKLPPGPARMLRALAATYPKGIDRSAIAQASGMSPTSSSVSAALSTLNANGLIEKQGRFVRASESLFPA